MKIIPVHVWNHRPSADSREGLIIRSKDPVLATLMEERKSRLRQLQDQESYLLDRIILESRVIVVEGISGSGKDTFQAYLKKKLEGRDVYDYYEDDVLHSWKHLQIEGIFELRIKFMKLLVNHVRDVINRDENAVFLLNRFHLSTYVSTITKQPELEREYNQIINVLRTLPVHVFILQLDENEIEKRSVHPERSSAWRKFQQQIMERDGFRGKLERHIWQQKLVMETAKRQRIPYSVIKLAGEPEIGARQVRISEAPSIVRPAVRMNAADPKIPRRKRHLPPTL